MLPDSLPLRRVFKGKQLDLRMFDDLQIQFVRAAFLPILFVNDAESENVRVKMFRPFIVGTNNGDMVNASEVRRSPPFSVCLAAFTNSSWPDLLSLGALVPDFSKYIFGPTHVASACDAEKMLILPPLQKRLELLLIRC